MEEIIQVQNQYYILATSPLADIRSLSLKEGDTFIVCDRYGDILPIGLGEQGLYRDGTKFLSRYEFSLEGRKPLLLSSTVRRDNFLITSDLTNHDISLPGRPFLPKDSVHIFRGKFIFQNSLYERIRFHNYSTDEAHLTTELTFDADFRDIFEIRGITRKRRGEREVVIPSSGDTVVFRYRGLDGVVRRTVVRFSPPPHALNPGEAKYSVTLKPGEVAEIYVTVACLYEGEREDALPFPKAFEKLKEQIQSLRGGCIQVTTSNEQVNEWLDRSLSDLIMMLTFTEQGAYPYAGIPWFATPFGRDGIITALSSQWLCPQVGKGVLSFLAATQAKEENPELDAEPGKIVHEIRKGEMANTGEIPFGRYYGSIDATPLFVVLAEEHFRQTGDLPLIKSVWENILDALRWIERYGDIDGDGFVEYERKTPRGIIQQGWKDSHDSVFHADGTIAPGPIALAEVQAYVYAALRAGGRLAQALGFDALSDELNEKAARLKGKFENSFWDEDLGTYALALDGEKKKCRVRTSNAGQVLFSGIASPERARKVADLLMSDDFFTGWGIRTVARGEARFNPMSYHNGSVWPHDNALIGWGFLRYGFRDHFERLFAGIFSAATTFDMYRVPELFCGFPKRPGEGPTLYPVACTPQSWASASVFLFLRSALGLCFNVSRNEISFNHPLLPDFIRWVELKNVRMGEGSVSVRIERFRNDIVINVIEKDAPITVVVRK